MCKKDSEAGSAQGPAGHSLKWGRWHRSDQVSLWAEPGHKHKIPRRDSGVWVQKETLSFL